VDRSWSRLPFVPKLRSTSFMARTARVVAEGVPYHITQRGNDRQNVLLLGRRPAILSQSSPHEVRPARRRGAGLLPDDESRSRRCDPPEVRVVGPGLRADRPRFATRPEAAARCRSRSKSSLDMALQNLVRKGQAARGFIRACAAPGGAVHALADVVLLVTALQLTESWLRTCPCPQASASGSEVGASGVARTSRPAGPTSWSASQDVDREVDAAGWEACATKEDLDPHDILEPDKEAGLGDAAGSHCAVQV